MRIRLVLFIHTLLVSDWDFFTDADPTHGNVNYQSQAQAVQKGLAFVQADGTTVLKVDNFTNVAVGGNRDSCVYFIVSVTLLIVLIRCYHQRSYQLQKDVQWWSVHCRLLVDASRL